MLFEKRRHMATTSELWMCYSALRRYLRVYMQQNAVGVGSMGVAPHLLLRDSN
jgi:hypothetical protein